MLNKGEFLNTHPDVHTGMDAYSVDGEKLGEVERLDDDSITIEKGWFFPRDFTIRYDDVVDIREDRLVVSRSRADLEGWRDEGYSGWNEYDRANMESPRKTGRQETRKAGQEETRIPLREEELEAEKQRREGEVRLRKTVHTESKHMEVPLEKEDVEIERVPAEEPEARDIGEAEFREEDVRIPIVEEEVEVRKRPVVKEEVRARKQSRTQQKDVSGKIRKEDVKVEREEPKRNR
jgi:uncharacterized protein (TIGR02271 family)